MNLLRLQSVYVLVTCEFVACSCGYRFPGTRVCSGFQLLCFVLCPRSAAFIPSTRELVANSSLLFAPWNTNLPCLQSVVLVPVSQALLCPPFLCCHQFLICCWCTPNIACPIFFTIYISILGGRPFGTLRWSSKSVKKIASILVQCPMPVQQGNSGLYWDELTCCTGIEDNSGT
ncbi:hypothetical protein IscW_ISCW007363 [Ixodes scapularis]|uniref:Secreted protein n=1 Tax=Ixodes scapularis TaxID=6945 RepID=B7PV32_IXOSC|nr:hypothetical protein IscW_ISCW007363 [Ixodes scapularis]|eukprot:XP_002407201.1 hypothetical protein IscW_ISCW007363 [Ixodes scapularis]